MALGPESTIGVPIASLWVTLKPDSFSHETFEPFGNFQPRVSFYSILFPLMDLGEQESNWYQQTTACPGTLFGFANGIIGVDQTLNEFIEGEICVEMERIILNSADVPETIEVRATFTATER
jgi:hypothetical protein